MSSDKSSLAVTMEKINVPLSVTKDDLIAIAITEYETQTSTRIGVLEVEKTTIEEANSKFSDEAQEEVEKALRAAVDVSKLVKSMKALGFPDALVELEKSCTIIRNEAGLHTNCSVEVYMYASKTAKTGSRNRSYGGYSSAYLGRTHTIKIPASAKKKLEQVDDNKEAIMELMEEILKLRRQLQDLPRMEREARARFARHILEQTEQGRELLSQVGSIKSLPEIIEDQIATVGTKTDKKKKKVANKAKGRCSK